MNLLRLLLCSLGLAVLTACGGGGSDAPSSPPPGAASATVAVTVIDTQGRVVAGATVTSPSGSGTTDAAGVASLPVATGSEQVLALRKDGFAEQVKVLNLATGTSAGALQAMLIAREAPLTIAAIEAGGSVNGKDGVKVTLPPGALVTAGGAAVTGAVQLTLTPVDVTQLDVGAFPGLFEGTPVGGTRSPIASFGSVELVPQQGGVPLNLAPGKTAQIELPLYERRQQDGTEAQVGNSIALWTLDTATGLWTQQGTGTVVTSADSPTGLALRATITHFSWWNIDAVAQRGTVTLTVTATGFTVPAGTTAAIEGRVVAGSGPSSLATASVTVGQATQFGVPANATTRLSASFNTPTGGCFGSVDVSPAPGASVSVVIDAACFEVPFPHIVRPSGSIATNSSRDLSVQVLLEGQRADTVEVFAGSALIQSFNLVESQPFVTAFWNTSTFAEGTYSLQARATRGGVTRNGNTVQVTIDRTPPHAVAIGPTPGSEVRPDTTYAVDFDEPVTSAPFALSDVVKLTVTPLGQNTPQPLQATLAYDGVQRRLTATLAPNQTLPLGTVGLSWGGLRDGAGNAVAGTLGATWSVARTATLAAVGGLFSNSTLVMNTNSAGTVFTLHRRASDGNLVVSRLDASGLVPIGPVVNDRTPGGDATGSIVADASGVPVVAFVQANAAGTAGEVVVKRFDTNANTWATLVAPFALAVTQNQTILPKLQLNTAGQPVLVFSNQAALRGFRFDGTAWVDLGSFADAFIGQLDMVLDSNGNPIASAFDGNTLRVLRNTGSAWVVTGSLDSAPDGTHGIGSVSMALDGAGQPWLSWLHFHGTNVLHLVRFDGTAFVNVPLPTSVPSGHPALAFVAGDPVITLGDDSSNVLRFHGNDWEPALPVAIDGRGPVIAAPSGNALVLAVTGNGNGQSTLLKVAFP